VKLEPLIEPWWRCGAIRTFARRRRSSSVPEDSASLEVLIVTLIGRNRERARVVIRRRQVRLDERVGTARFAKTRDMRLSICHRWSLSTQSKVGAIHLDEGSHKIRAFYFQGPDPEIGLQLFATPPGGQERLWGAEL